MTPTTLTTSGVVIGTRGQEPDIDMATQIVEMIGRKYVVTLRDEPATPFSMSFYRVEDIVVIRPHWHSERVDLFDSDVIENITPDWAYDIKAYVKRLTQPEEATT